MANSQKIFGCCNVFSLAKGLTITEIVWVVGTLILSFTVGSVNVSALGILIPMIPIAYLAIEYIGIHKKNKCLIIFGCVFRAIVVISVLPSYYYVFSSYVCQQHNVDCETIMNM